jgi:endo-1,4-beta-xylanase
MGILQYTIPDRISGSTGCHSEKPGFHAGRSNTSWAIRYRAQVMMNKKLSRRDFLKLADITSAGLALSACGVNVTESPISTLTLLPSVTPSPVPSVTATITPEPPAMATLKPPETLREWASAAGINLGVSLPEWYFNGNQSYLLKSMVEPNFNAITAQGLYLLFGKPFTAMSETDFALHDKEVQYAKLKNMVISGSHLLWQRMGADISSDSWLITIDNYADLIKVIEQHVGQMVQRYADVSIWNVVNEPTESFWFNRFGQDYSWMEKAFTVANETNPKAQLLLNDFGIEIPESITYDKPKRDKILELATNLIQKGIPIDGIGFQTHVFGKDFKDEQRAIQLMKGFQENIQSFQKAGFNIYITELDVRMDQMEEYTLSERLQIQATAYSLIVETALGSGIDNITIFGVWDEHSWFKQYYGIKDADALLFDTNQKPKPDFIMLKETIQKYAQGK